MSAEPDGPRDAGWGARRRAHSSDDTRSERRTLRGAARRRRARTRFWLVAVPTVLVIALVVALLVLLGGNGAPVVVGATSTTVAEDPAGGKGLLVVEQDGTAVVLVALQPRERDGLVLGIPGITLLKSDVGFTTLADLYASGRKEALLGALREELGVRVDAVASVTWPQLREALVAAGVPQAPGERLVPTGAECDSVADSLLALLARADHDGDSEVWDQVGLRGDARRFRAGLDSPTSLPTGGSWRSGALTGRLVEGDGFTYLEPEADRLALLLDGPGEGSAITVEIQNGAGTLGVVESAIAELEALGYAPVSAGNSADFPDVRETRVVVAIDAADVGERVRLVLGVGAITEDLMLDPGHVVVVLGRDYLPWERAAD